jgi:hypothetical protein
MHCIFQEEAPGIAVGMDFDDEELVVSSTGGQSTDPFSRQALAKDTATGKYPLMMPCKHVYNYATIMSKKSQGIWALTKCAGESLSGHSEVHTYPYIHVFMDISIRKHIYMHGRNRHSLVLVQLYICRCTHAHMQVLNDVNVHHLFGILHCYCFFFCSYIAHACLNAWHDYTRVYLRIHSMHKRMHTHIQKYADTHSHITWQCLDALKRSQMTEVS